MRAVIPSILGHHLNFVKGWTIQNSVVHLSFTITLKISLEKELRMISLPNLGKKNNQALISKCYVEPLIFNFRQNQDAKTTSPRYSCGILLH